MDLKLTQDDYHIEMRVTKINQKENLSQIRMPLSFRNELPTINLYESKINLKDDYHFEMTATYSHKSERTLSREFIKKYNILKEGSNDD